MHRKRVLYIQEGMQPHGRYARLTAEIDADFDTCTLDDAIRALPEADLVMYVLTDARSTALAELEQRLRAVEHAALLIVIEPDSLETLRLPAHVHADFALSTAPDAELLIRMRHLLWPGEETANSDFITIDSMVVNLSTYQVLVDGAPVDFTYLEYALLAFLITHAGHVYSRDALLARVWGFDYFGGSRTVDVHVRRVRSKLGNDLAAHLRTVRGVGYMWE